MTRVFVRLGWHEAADGAALEAAQLSDLPPVLFRCVSGQVVGSVEVPGDQGERGVHRESITGGED